MLTSKSVFFYFQTLLLRRDALLKLTTGHIIDLVSNDVQRLEQEAIKWGFYWVMSCFEIVVVTFFTRLFDWLAVSPGNSFSVFSCAIFRWIVICWSYTALAHSSGFRQAPLVDEPGGPWDTCHQNACVGRSIPRENKTFKKV